MNQLVEVYKISLLKKCQEFYRIWVYAALNDVLNNETHARKIFPDNISDTVYVQNASKSQPYTLMHSTSLNTNTACCVVAILQ